ADLKIEPEPTPLFQAELDSRQAGILRMLTVVSFLVIWPAIIAAIVAYFIGLARRQINHRQTLLLLLLSFFFFLLIGLLGSYADNFRIGFRISGARPAPVVEQITQWVLFVLINLALATGLYFLYAAGTSVSVKNLHRRTIDFELALKGKFLTRPVMESYVGGLLAGGLLCALPYILPASGLFRDMRINASGLEDSFSARLPAVVSFTDISQYRFFLVFAFIAP